MELIGTVELVYPLYRPVGMAPDTDHPHMERLSLDRQVSARVPQAEDTKRKAVELAVGESIPAMIGLSTQPSWRIPVQHRHQEN